MNPENGIFSIEGKSYPENVMRFYQPVFDWLVEYGKSPNEETKLIVKLDYHNTATMKVLLYIMNKLSKMQGEGHKILIQWFYAGEEEESREEGEDLLQEMDLPFEFISY
ncbi:MAG: DUF1987 domain-containing protein [Bacteroidetes bacterium]|nr:DUF1987 domain-containing protein [Bacteroidota bacterium]